MKTLTSLYLQNTAYLGFETRFCIESDRVLSSDDLCKLEWVIAETYQPELLSRTTQTEGRVIEFGPRLSVTTAFSSNAVMICRAIGLDHVTRIEKMRRERWNTEFDLTVGETLASKFDEMIEQSFYPPIDSFDTGSHKESVFQVPVLEKGKQALRDINDKMKLGMDDFDIDLYYELFVTKLRRNPTNVECFQLGQANSEHCRHWFFRAVIVIDGIETSHSLMELVKEPLQARGQCNSLVAFGDNSSAIHGFDINVIVPVTPGKSSAFVRHLRRRHILLTVETHNHPTMHQAYRGAETGTGGRIRDIQMFGRGGIMVAGTAGYCTASLFIPGYHIPGEDSTLEYSDEYRRALNIMIEASNGASDYGNQIGEAVINGFARAFDMRLPNGERWGWLKPIMLSGGIGFAEDEHVKKGKPESGMVVVQIGGPAFDVGFGGGAASSMEQGKSTKKLDLASVQRGDAQMGQRVNRVVRACINLGSKNPIVSAHDQGAGGPCNVITEIIEPKGAEINLSAINLGDSSLPAIKIWGAEYQERNAVLVYEDGWRVMKEICERERVPCERLGVVTGDGHIKVYEKEGNEQPIVDLPLDLILGNVPRKTFKFERIKRNLVAFEIPKDKTVAELLKMTLAQVAVGSKMFLTSKVDRSVGGLIAQQQCCGPTQLPVSDYGLVAMGYDSVEGAAFATGERPISMLINPKAGARMALAETITNLIFVGHSGISNIKTSVNWMWPAKLPGEGAEMYDAAVALRDMMLELRGAECDGGKDSLSMAAKVKGETVKSPRQCVITGYVDVDDIHAKVTPDLKWTTISHIGYIDLAKGKCRMGGSSLAQALGQIGDGCPDVEDPKLLACADAAIKELLFRGLIRSGHDRSDGGLITTLVEMALAGNVGLEVDFRGYNDIVQRLFNEELGLVIEYYPDDRGTIENALLSHGVGGCFRKIGSTNNEGKVWISFTESDRTETVLMEDLTTLREWYEATSNQLERLQMDPDVAKQAVSQQVHGRSPTYELSFVPTSTPQAWISSNDKPKVAVIRDLGSNGDAEMVGAFMAAGFEVHDVLMTDFLDGRVTSLDQFRGAAFVGGFSNADAFGSAKGWAAQIKFNKELKEVFDRFYYRPDTFSLGVCNGCQLMSLLGWVPGGIIDERKQVRFIHNKSKRFDHRWVRLRIQQSMAMMFNGMEGSVLGVPSAHGEGLMYVPDQEIMAIIAGEQLVPLTYVNDQNVPTEVYPYNPNGSPYGAAALCSLDGRHLAMMPHMERAFLKWQWHYLPPEFQELEVSPWLMAFQNARRWCDEVRMV